MWNMIRFVLGIALMLGIEVGLLLNFTHAYSMGLLLIVQVIGAIAVVVAELFGFYDRDDRDFEYGFFLGVMEVLKWVFVVELGTALLVVLLIGIAILAAGIWPDWLAAHVPPLAELVTQLTNGWPG